MATPCEIRLATRDDIPAVQEVGRDADRRFVELGRADIADGTTIPDAVAARAVDNGRLWVATVGGEVVGWAYVGRVGGELSLGQISVARAFGQRGIGSALLARVVEAARAAGEPSIVLNTELDVPWGARWYARWGFEVVPADALTAGQREVSLVQEGGGLDVGRRVHMRRVV